MLMRFSISNFMSFGYETDKVGNVVPVQYHLYAGRSEQHKGRIINFGDRKVLKFSAIYGANASGKTNLIHAMNAGKNIVLKTMKENELRELYCRGCNANAEMPSFFEYEFTIDERCFAYGFTVNLNRGIILTEWLYEMLPSEEKIIFERIAEENQYFFDESYFKDSENRSQFHFFLKDVNRIRNSLLLYEMNRRNMESEEFDIFNKIYNWFKEKLVIVYPETKIGASYFLFGNDNEKLIKILKYLDTGITSYKMREINETAFKEYFSNDSLAEKILRRPDTEKKTEIQSIFKIGNTLFELKYDESRAKLIQKLVFQHGMDEGQYEYGEESDGTKRIIELLGIILNEDKDKVFIIDELDRSLHPQMTIKFVETFLNFSQGKETQLIITTHESNLMDLSILRRDEIWFAEKQYDNNTKLYTLEKFKIRYDKVVSKDYLAGRYGAVPVFKDFEYVWGGNEFEKTELKNSETV